MAKFSKLHSEYSSGLKSLSGELILPKGYSAYKFKDEEGYYWIRAKGMPRSLFKPDDSFNHAFSEILYMFLAHEIGLDVVNVAPAVLVNNSGETNSGVLVESFLQKRNTTAYHGSIFLQDFGDKYYKNHTIANYKQAFKACITHSYPHKTVTIQPDFKHQLHLIFLLDVATLNFDRHNQNIVVLKTETEHSMHFSLSKTFDNAFAFGLLYFKKSKLNNQQLSDTSLYTKNFKLTLNPIKDHTETNFNYCANELSELMMQDKSVRIAFEKLLALDFNKLIASIKQAFPQYQINSDEQNFAKQLFSNAIGALEHHYKQHVHASVNLSSAKKQNATHQECEQALS